MSISPCPKLLHVKRRNPHTLFINRPFSFVALSTIRFLPKPARFYPKLSPKSSGNASSKSRWDSSHCRHFLILPPSWIIDNGANGRQNSSRSVTLNHKERQRRRGRRRARPLINSMRITTKRNRRPLKQTGVSFADNLMLGKRVVSCIAR